LFNQEIVAPVKVGFLKCSVNALYQEYCMEIVLEEFGGEDGKNNGNFKIRTGQLSSQTKSMS
jgi:hypothetical protein